MRVMGRKCSVVWWWKAFEMLESVRGISWYWGQLER